MTDMEEKLIEDFKAGKEISLEKGLLIISGLNTEKEIETYGRKLDQIHGGFVTKQQAKGQTSWSPSLRYMHSTRAKHLFEYLWNVKPMRCNSNFLLADVIDAQLNPKVNQRVGSCVGLTSLYTVLGLREGLDLTILVSDSHIVNKLSVDENIYHIDNTDPLGFNYDLGEKYFIEYPAIYLLANVLNSRGMAKESGGDLQRAEEDYHKAITINPNYPNGHNNRGNIKLKRTDYRGAIRDYDRAIELYAQLTEAYYNRGIAKEGLGDHDGAIQDFDRAIELKPEDADTYWRRGIVRENLGDYSGAIEDFEKVSKLDPESEIRIMLLKQRAERRRKDMGA
jgi:tetratricopeptide (TPR) repeat protein